MTDTATGSPSGPGRPRAGVAALPAYVPGKNTKQVEDEHQIAEAIKLASNENPLPPLPSVVEAVAEAARGLNRYADHRATAVRARLAEVIGVAEESVTVGCGSSALLQQVLLSYVDPGDEVVYPWRSFEVYPIYTQLVAGRSIQVPLDDDFAVDVDAVISAVTADTKVVMVATPNNPTGTALPNGALRRLLEAVPPSVIVVADEAYREFVGPDIDDPVDLLADHPHLVITRTLSKAHGLAGLRVGYALGHPEVISSIDKTQIPFAVNALAQAGALAVLDPDADEEIRRRATAIVSERRRVFDALHAAGWSIPATEANFVWLPLGAATADVAVGLERAGVVTRPFAGEGVRVTIGTAAENDRFLAALADVAPSPS